MNSSSASSDASSEPSVVDPPAGSPATVTAAVPVTAPPLPESSVLQLATAVADLIQDLVAAGRNPLMSTPSAGPATASTSSSHTTVTPSSSEVPGSGKSMLIVA